MTLNFKAFLEAQEDPPDLKKFLQTECSSFMNSIGDNGLLYRGASNLGSAVGKFESGGTTFSVYKRSVRKDRVPLEMDRRVSAIIDNWFDKHFGFKARSQALFCYGEGGRLNAETYGSKQCVIFPIGRFSAVWSPKIGDLFLHVEEEIFTTRKEIAPEYATVGGSPSPIEIGEWMDTLQYTKNHLDKVTHSDSEIMVDCDEVLYIPYAYNTLSQLHEGLGIKK
jgi:hypothetical protein